MKLGNIVKTVEQLSNPDGSELPIFVDRPDENTPTASITPEEPELGLDGVKTATEDDEIGNLDDLIVTLEEETYDSQVAIQQLALLQNTFDIIADTKDVTQPQVRALAVQLTGIQPYLSQDDQVLQKAVLEALIKADDDTRLQVTNEAVGLSMRVLGPALIALAFILAQVVKFMRNRNAEKAMREALDGAGRALARALSERNGYSNADQKATFSDQGQMKEIFRDFDFYEPLSMNISSYNATSNNFDAIVPVIDSLAALASFAKKTTETMDRQLSRGLDQSVVDKCVADLAAEYQKTVEAVSRVGTPMPEAAARTLYDGVVPSGTKLCVGFGIFRGSLPIALAFDEEGTVKLLRANSGEGHVPRSMTLTLNQIMDFKTTIEQSTWNTFELLHARRSIFESSAKQIESSAKNLASRNSTGPNGKVDTTDLSKMIKRITALTSASIMVTQKMESQMVAMARTVKFFTMQILVLRDSLK